METTPELELGAGHRREQQPCSPSSEVWLGSCDKCHLPYRTHPPKDISKPLELKCERMECTGTAVMKPLDGFPEKSDDEKWRDYFVLPIAAEMKHRGIGEMRIKLTEKGTAVFELLPENAESMHAGEDSRK